MSEPVNDGLKPESRTVMTLEKTSPGAMLRAAREAQGLNVEILAMTLKVPVNKLEALEADRFDLLLDTVFVRSLALGVCRALRIDASQIMLELPQLQTPQIKTDESGLNTSYKVSGGSSHNALISQLGNPVGWGVLLLLVIIAVILFWPAKITDETLASVGNGIQPAQGAASEGATGFFRQPEPDLLDQTLKSSPELATPGVAIEPAAITSAGSNNASSGISSALEPVSLPAVASLHTGTEVLTITASGASWVEVNDAKGVSQLRKLTSDGDVLRISGALPLTVVLGRADLLSVTIHGQPFDLATVSKDNVARFEVK